MSTALQATVMLVLARPPIAQPAPNARPTGGVVVAGAAAISQTATNTAINQSTPARRGELAELQCRQPAERHVQSAQSASAVTLNRVTGPDPSQIAGRIDANGQIVLVNQSGVTFYKGAQVNANGLMVDRGGHQHAELHGRRHDRSTRRPSPNARIDNQGTHHRQAGGSRRAGGAAGGQLRRDQREARPCRAGRCEDRDARSVWRRAAVARRHQSGDSDAARRQRPAR